jgi:hypothetical protein
MKKPITESDIKYAEMMHRQCLDRYGKDDSRTKMWRSKLRKLNNLKSGGG